jgi:hypothetical protein
LSSSATESSQLLSPPPFWSVVPDQTDWLAWAAIATIGLSIYLVFYLYGLFDSWAEQNAEGTPLAKTIPTLLGIALLYEIFPLDHFSILLPASAILIALMADWRNERNKIQQELKITPSSGPDAVLSYLESLVANSRVNTLNYSPPNDQEPVNKIQMDGAEDETVQGGATNV